MSKSSKKRGSVASKRKPTMIRRTFMFDPGTDDDVAYIRDQIRATSDSEAVRRAVRKMADLLRRSSNGVNIVVERSGQSTKQVELV